MILFSDRNELCNFIIQTYNVQGDQHLFSGVGWWTGGWRMDETGPMGDLTLSVAMADRENMCPVKKPLTLNPIISHLEQAEADTFRNRLTYLVTHLVWPHQPENPPGRPIAWRNNNNNNNNNVRLLNC